MTSDFLMDNYGNFGAYTGLVDLLKKGKGIAFVGAGASFEIYGGWSALIDFLTQKALEAGCASCAEARFWRFHAARRPQHVARAIKQSLEPEVYRHILREYFAPKGDNRRYTSLHKAIVNLPVRGIITTNYDQCLEDAWSKCAFDENLSINVGTWQDESYVLDWHNGDIFEKKAYPIFYIHGKWNNPEGIILDNDSYRAAYRDGVYFRMIRELWTTQQLIIIGVGFSDSWVDRLLDDILTYALLGAARPRHFALIGFRDEDEPHLIQIRRMMQNAYNANVIFYPIKYHQGNDGKLCEDHGALCDLLARLGPLKDQRVPYQDINEPEPYRQNFSSVDYIRRV